MLKTLQRYEGKLRQIYQIIKDKMQTRIIVI